MVTPGSAAARRLAQRGKGYIGVDFDGTIAVYHGWSGWNVFGDPIMPMIERIKCWLAEGHEVRIVTARVGLPIFDGVSDPIPSHYKRHSCRVTGDRFSDADMVKAIQEYLVKHGLPALAVQCHKGAAMIELWDDIAVQVVPNTGQTLGDAHEAELSALKGEVFEASHNTRA